MSGIVIVTGSRDLDREGRKRVYRVLDARGPARVIEGGCPTGADLAARLWRKHHGVEGPTYEANWARYGKRAGFIRNGLMLRHWPMATVLAFPLPQGRGTQDCIRQAQRLGMTVEVFHPV